MPRFGLMSDTHGDAGTCRLAAAFFKDEGVDVLLHAGDIGDDHQGRLVLDELAGTPCHFVFGNNDFTRPDLAHYAAGLDLTCHGDVGKIELFGRRVLLTHGDDSRALRHWTTAADRGQPPADLLITGHSHVPHDRWHGSLRWINPGALFRARPRTVALLHLADAPAKDALTFHPIAV